MLFRNLIGISELFEIFSVDTPSPFLRTEKPHSAQVPPLFPEETRIIPAARLSENLLCILPNIVSRLRFHLFSIVFAQFLSEILTFLPSSHSVFCPVLPLF